MTRHTAHAPMTRAEAEAWLRTASLHDAFKQHVDALRELAAHGLAVDEIDHLMRGLFPREVIAAIRVAPEPLPVIEA